MGASLCTPWHPEPKSRPPASGSSFMKFFKLKCLKKENRIRRSRSENESKNLMKMKKTWMEKPDQKKVMIKATRKLTLEDWLLASPTGLQPDYLRRGKKKSAKKVHPSSSSSQVPRSSSLYETKDSLCLDRPMNREEAEGDGLNSESSSVLCRSSNGKSQKRVSFKLPHTVILYTPDQPYHCSEPSYHSPAEEPYHCSEPSYHSPAEETYNSSEVSFYSPSLEANCRRDPFDSQEELAGNTLPPVTVSASP